MTNMDKAIGAAILLLMLAGSIAVLIPNGLDRVGTMAGVLAVLCVVCLVAIVKHTDRNPIDHYEDDDHTGV